MRLLRTVALLLSLWVISATIYFNLHPQRLIYDYARPAVRHMSQKKEDHANVLIVAATVAAISCWGLVAILGLTRKKSNATADANLTDTPPIPRSSDNIQLTDRSGAETFKPEKP